MKEDFLTVVYKLKEGEENPFPEFDVTKVEVISYGNCLQELNDARSLLFSFSYGQLTLESLEEFYKKYGEY